MIRVSVTYYMINGHGFLKKEYIGDYTKIKEGTDIDNSSMWVILKQRVPSQGLGVLALGTMASRHVSLEL